MSRSERLREIATSVGEELADRETVEAVLLTGSTATGYADEYSDIDLEIVGSTDAGQHSVEDVHIEWTPVTCEEVEAKLEDWTDDAALYTYAHAELLYDDIGLADLLAAYDNYPRDVRREKLYAGWFYGSGNVFDARKAEQRGDTRVKRCAAVSAVEQFTALTYVLKGAFPPYRKWLFCDYPIELPEIDAALAGDLEALDTIESTMESKLREPLADDRIENPYLSQPQYKQLG